MITVTQLTDNILKFTGEDKVNCYLLLQEKIMIDTGNPVDRENLQKELSKSINLLDIKTVILTHLHYDHSGNISIFPKAKFFASKEEIQSFHNKKSGAVFNENIVDDLNQSELIPLPDSIPNFEIIHTPGHTSGSICLVYNKQVLFSGDTKFGEDRYGRTDLPTSMPRKLDDSVEKLEKYKDLIFAPGHDYV